ncbi:MAG: phage minor capsid protein [Ruminococcus sp.]
MQQNYEPNADRIIALYQQLEDDILSAIVRRMLKMGYVSDATKHQIEVLQAAGLLYDDIIQMIADRTDASTAQVKALFEDAGVQTVSIDNDIYEKAGEIPVDIRQDDSMKQVLEAGYKKTLGTMQNLVRTTANNAQTAFIQMCDRIYMQVASGAFSYQEAIRFALRELADTGAYITYPTGHTDRLDVAVRRCVLTGVSQTAAAVAKQQAENADCQYMELTAHSGARPEHAKWQGQLVIIKGKRTKLYIDGLKVFTLSEIGYGDGAGFKGWNCRHNWHPYYVGYSTPNYTQEELKKLDEPCIPYNGTLYTEYQISQMQRAGERKVRAWKRRCITAQEGVNSAADDVTKAAAQAEYSKSAVHLKANEEKLKDFCKQTGQDRDRFREQVYGFGRSEAQRAVQAAKKAANAKSIHKKNSIKPAEKSEKVLTLEQNNDIIRDERIVSAIADGRISLKLNSEKQNPHILNAPGYDPTKNKSYFTISLEELQGIIDEKHGTGEITIGKNGVANAKEYITMPYDIGECISPNGENLGKTNRFRVHYSKNRTHAVPTKRKEKDDGFI